MQMIDFFFNYYYVLFGWLTCHIMLGFETEFDSLLLFFFILCFCYLMTYFDI